MFDVLHIAFVGSYAYWYEVNEQTCRFKHHQEISTKVSIW